MASSRHLRCLIFALLLSALHAHALEVRQVLWGFDGRVVPNRFNPVSVLISNPDGKVFDDALSLTETRGLNISDADIVQPAYLAPQTQRWVQFHVFVRGSSEFRLRWRGGSADVPNPTTSGPARVILTDPANPFVAAASLKTFPDDLFPTSLAATDALDAVVLDYAPRWDAARRDAFLDWLRRGGIVLVIHGAGGAYPQFTETLAPLNIDGDSARVGSGHVLRQPVTRREVNEDLFAKRGFAAPELKTSKEPIVQDLEHTLLDRLASLTRPQISWWLINLLTLLYVGLVGPLHYRWARRRDYRVSIGIFLGTVALFGFLFSVVGRRGYGESQTVHSLSIARSLGGGRCDVMQWISAFATQGDVYTLTHTAPANFYSGVPQSDAVRGKILNGKDGRFLADIPLYSSRPFVHRAVMLGDDTGVTVEAWEATAGELKALQLKTGPNFPKEVLDVRAIFRGRAYTVDVLKDGLKLASNVGSPIEQFLSRDKLQPLVYGGYYNNHDDKPADEQLRSLLPLLQARALGGTAMFYEYVTQPVLPADQVQLLIFARAPEGFRMRGQGFDRENGHVLYVQDVFSPTPAN